MQAFQRDSHPRYRISTLGNGLRVMSEEVPTVESFALGIWINTGTRDEPEGLAGVAHFVEHATFRRTATRTSRQISAEFEDVGAYTNAFTTKEHTCYYVRALKPHFRKTLRLMADVVLHPVFQASDIEKERLIILEEIKSYEDEPEELIADYADILLFGEHPLGKPILGLPETVGAMGVEDIKGFFRREYTARNMVVAVTGNITHEQVLREVEKIFGSMPGEEFSRSRISPPEPKPQRLVINRPIQQAHILLSRRTPGFLSQEKYSLAVFNTLLGEGMSSRLHQRIREKSGLAYTVYSAIGLLTDCGVLSVYAGMDEKNLAKTERLIAEELTKLREKPVPRPELRRAKEQLKANVIMSLESMSARMQMIAKGELEEGGYEDAAHTIAAIDAVSSEELFELARKYCDIENWSTAVLLPD